MDKIQKYQIVVTAEFYQDLRRKSDFITANYHDRTLARTWSKRLLAEIQRDLSAFPEKYPLYQGRRQKDDEIRLLLYRNDVVMYSVSNQEKCVYLHGVCTKGMDIDGYLEKS